MSNRQGESYESFRVDVEQSHRVSEVTIAYYDRMAEAYWDGTRDHDVSQNYAAFLDAIGNDPPYSILDLGCGPGRDLHHFRLLGHNAVGLDGSTEFVAMARSYSGCEVLHQDFLTMIAAVAGDRMAQRLDETVLLPETLKTRRKRPIHFQD